MDTFLRVDFEFAIQGGLQTLNLFKAYILHLRGVTAKVASDHCLGSLELIEQV